MGHREEGSDRLFEATLLPKSPLQREHLVPIMGWILLLQQAYKLRYIPDGSLGQSHLMRFGYRDSKPILWLRANASVRKKS